MPSTLRVSQLKAILAQLPDDSPVLVQIVHPTEPLDTAIVDCVAWHFDPAKANEDAECIECDEQALVITVESPV